MGDETCQRTEKRAPDDVHKNAKLAPRGRDEIVRRVLDQGPTPAPVVQQIAALRRRRWNGAPIAAEVGVSTATVSRVLRRLGLNRLKALEPAEPVRRYEREHPGELIHIDIKKLGRFDRPGHRVTGDRTGQSNRRGIGWEYLHVCIDDHSRVAFSQILPDEKKESAVAFLNAALAYYNSLGVTVSRVMTDNGACYKAHAFRNACRTLGLKHIRTRSYTPKTNGKAERFIQTALREWAYARTYDHSEVALLFGQLGGLRCIPVGSQAARIPFMRSSCCCCCACGDVGKARSGLSIISTGGSLRSASSATFAFSSPENLRRLLLICIPPSGDGIHLNAHLRFYGSDIALLFSPTTAGQGEFQKPSCPACNCSGGQRPCLPSNSTSAGSMR